MALTPKQERFVSEYLIDLNATQAAIRAGYAAGSADVQGARLLGNASVRDAIDLAKMQRSEEVKIDAAYVLRQAVKLHERCMQEIIPFTDRKGDHIHDEQGHPLYVFNTTGAAKALELVGKHVTVNAFQETVNVKGLDALADRMERAMKREG